MGEERGWYWEKYFEYQTEMGEEAADIEKKMFCISKSQAHGGSHLVYPYQGIIANAHILSWAM